MNSQKKLITRITIALLGIPIVVGLVYLGDIYLTIFLIIVSSLALRELFKLLNNKGIPPNKFTTIFCGVILLLVAGLQPNYVKYAVPFIIIILLLTILLGNIKYSVKSLSSSIFSVVYVPINLCFLLLLRRLNTIGFELTLMTFITVWTCDTFAYSFGSWLGHKPLAPKISPKKSIIGAIAGFFGSILTVTLLYFFNFLPPEITFLSILGFGALTGIFTQIGDLIESVIKRDMEVKDSGSILLGHGGVLDRFDSLLIVAPVVYLYSILIF